MKRIKSATVQDRILLRVRDVAEVLAVSEREVWNMIRRGDLRTIRVPGRRMTRVYGADVEALVLKWRDVERA
jgi:excisionase family DNA binding protein